MAEIAKIISGGQSGVDRAALDAALELGIAYGGWCPRGGWAEDLPQPPGLLAFYPDLQATEESGTATRTYLNLRDSDATLVLWPAKMVSSPGTSLPVPERAGPKKSRLEVRLGAEGLAEEISRWIASIPGQSIVLNIGGPRESESPGIYQYSRELLLQVSAAIIPD